jgi:hypothetical protein
MAYNVRKISQLDLKPSTSIGVALPFNYSSVFKPVYTTKEQLKYNIINFMLTNKRERIFAPNFGAGLRSLVFSQITQGNLEEIKESIISKLESYFPSIDIIEFKLNGNTEFNQISIYFTYSIKNTGQDDSISVILQSTQ